MKDFLDTSFVMCNSHVWHDIFLLISARTAKYSNTSSHVNSEWHLSKHNQIWTIAQIDHYVLMEILFSKHRCNTKLVDAIEIKQKVIGVLCGDASRTHSNISKTSASLQLDVLSHFDTGSWQIRFVINSRSINFKRKTNDFTDNNFMEYVLMHRNKCQVMTWASVTVALPFEWVKEISINC